MGWPLIKRHLRACVSPSPAAPPAPDHAPKVQVAVQLPMFNERAVCQAIIDCCAELDWPAQRLKIQVGAGHEGAAAGSCPPSSPPPNRRPAPNWGVEEPCPSACLFLQVLDDSTDAVTRELVDEKVGGAGRIGQAWCFGH